MEVSLVLILLLVAVLAAFVYVSRKWALPMVEEVQPTPANLETRKALGFLPLEDSTQGENVQAILSLFQHHPSQKYALRQAYQKRMIAGQFLLFDLVYADGKPGTFRRNVMAGISNLFHLPTFTIIPTSSAHTNTQDALTAGAEKVFLYQIGQNNAERLRFPEYPEFDQRFLIISAQSEQARQFLTAARIHWLNAWQGDHQIEMGGNAFALIPKKEVVKGKVEASLSEEQLLHLLEDAKTFYAWLEK